MSHTFVIMAGGTGGHVFPGLAIAAELAKAGHRVEWLGTKLGIESTLVPSAGFPLHCLPVSGVRGKGILALLKAPFMILVALFSALRILAKVKPSCVIGFGGFAAGPGAVAAKILFKPLVIHEQNAVLGTTNGILQSFANRRLEAFPGTFKKRKSTFYTGNPVRENIAELSHDARTQQSGIAATRNILVVGGSRGARALNEALPDLVLQCAKRLPDNILVRHQSGEADLESVRKAYKENAIAAEVSAFIDDMAEAYRWADLVVCRAGAMTVAELTAAGLPSVLVPFPFAIDDHQTENARWLEKNGAGVVMPQPELLKLSAIDLLSELMGDEQRLKAMAQAAASIAVLDSASQVADHCMQLAQTGEER